MMPDGWRFMTMLALICFMAGSVAFILILIAGTILDAVRYHRKAKAPRKSTWNED